MRKNVCKVISIGLSALFICATLCTSAFADTDAMPATSTDVVETQGATDTVLGEVTTESPVTTAPETSAETETSGPAGHLGTATIVLTGVNSADTVTVVVKNAMYNISYKLTFKEADGWKVIGQFPQGQYTIVSATTDAAAKLVSYSADTTFAIIENSSNVISMSVEVKDNTMSFVYILRNNAFILVLILACCIALVVIKKKKAKDLGE